MKIDKLEEWKETITPDFNMENRLQDQKPQAYPWSKASTMNKNQLYKDLPKSSPPILHRHLTS